MSIFGRFLFSALFATLAAGAGVMSAAPPPTEPTAPCEMAEPDARWLQQALDGWDVARDFLGLEAGALPWIVLYDAKCVWHLQPSDARLVESARRMFRPLTFNGEQIEAWAEPHRGTILLPNRLEIPVEVKASTALYRNGRSAFLVMSMPSVWRKGGRHGSKPFLDEYLIGVFTHELVHTRQIVDINRRLRRLLRSTDLPGLMTDDVIQARFQKERGFARAVEQERNLLYKAVSTADPLARRAQVAKALDLVRARHSQHFTGPHQVYAEIEGLFLTMEGAGQWAAYRLARERTRSVPHVTDVLNLVRDDRRFWSQDIGLALFLLLDQMVPGWQARMFEPLPPSPFAVLEEALRE